MSAGGRFADYDMGGAPSTPDTPTLPTQMRGCDGAAAGPTSAPALDEPSVCGAPRPDVRDAAISLHDSRPGLSMESGIFAGAAARRL